uniref:Uncharacterized protein n=1 Tax=Quercus lobata TaxID=97700 RepID=A0A7N2MVQ2_QUELO
MKAILVVCFLLLSTFFIPSSNAARDLADLSAVTVPSQDPHKPVITCGRGKPYRECLPGNRKPSPPSKSYP